MNHPRVVTISLVQPVTKVTSLLVLPTISRVKYIPIV
jgi:hypothetical protein